MRLDFSEFTPMGDQIGSSRLLASVPMAAVMTMAPVTMSRSLPAIARVGVSAPIVLAICVRVELGALARISDYMLRRRRAGKRG
jgi:hypothetical protein